MLLWLQTTIKEVKQIVASGKIIDEDIVKNTQNITIKTNTLRKSIIVDKALNILETRMEEKENTISYLFKTIKTSKEDFKKEITRAERMDLWNKCRIKYADGVEQEH